MKDIQKADLELVTGGRRPGNCPLAMLVGGGMAAIPGAIAGSAIPGFGTSGGAALGFLGGAGYTLLKAPACFGRQRTRWSSWED